MDKTPEYHTMHPRDPARRAARSAHFRARLAESRKREKGQPSPNGREINPKRKERGHE